MSPMTIKGLGKSLFYPTSFYWTVYLTLTLLYLTLYCTSWYDL
jgi:hypothetical protein